MAKISTYPIISIPTIDDLLIGTDVNDLNITKNFTIGEIGNLIGQDYVPYIGATGNVNLGSFNITAAAFIVPGGLASQFVKADGSLDSTAYTPQTRTLTINGTTYNLSANRSWDLNTVDSLTTIGTSGAATYIGKVLNIPVYQAQGNYITQLSGEATGSGPGNTTVTLSNSAVIGKILTGLNVTGGTVVSTDTILQAFGKVQNQINGLTTGVTYQGVWNAATNVPFLQSSVGTQGYYYVVDVAGNTNLNGITDWQVGDWAIYNGTAWQKVDNTDAVVSVNGYVGAVVLTASDVGAVPTTRTLTINGVGYNLSLDRAWTVGDVRTDGSYANPSWITSLAWSKITSTPTTLAGYGITDGALNTRTLTINGTTFDLTANRTWNVGTVTSVGTSGPLTGGTITGSGTIGITQSGASTDGYLSSTDWNAFNSKQAAISVTAPITLVAGVLGITQAGASSDGYLSSTDWNTFNSKVSGSGTANTLPMWGSASSLINSPLSYAADTFNFQYNSATGGTVNFTNIGLSAYTYSIQMNNFGSPRSTVHSYTDGLIIQSIGGTQVSRMFANGNLILGTGTVDNGYKLEITGNLYVNTIANATVDTDRFIVSDGGVIKYRTGAEILADIGAQGALTLTTTGTSGPATLISNTLNIPNYGSALTGYVPYTGATQDLNLGTFGLIGDFVQFNPSSSNIPSAEGVMSWDNTDGTVRLSVKGNTYSVPIGQSVIARVHNSTGTNLLRTNYQVVKVAGAQGQRLAVSLAQANNDANSASTLGLVCENISNNQEGFIVNIGTITNINTTGNLQGETWLDGDVLYLSPTILGAITKVKPAAPQHTVIIGYVEYAHANNGKIYVKIDNGYELEELHDVAPTPYVNNGLLYRDTTLNLWKSATIDTILGYTPAPQGNYITSLTGEATASGPGAASVTLSNSAVTGKVLTGLNVAGNAIVSTDSILTAFGKLQHQVNQLVGGLQYEGTWNASTNTPTITSSVGTDGTFYIVSVAGTTNINGITDWQVGDWIVFHDTAWQKVDNSDSVSSVFGRVGNIVANQADYSAFYPLIGDIKDGVLTVQGTGVLSGSGTFSANQATNNTITITHATVSRTDTTSSQTPSFGGSFTAIDSVTSSAEGHVTAINTKTVTVPSTTASAVQTGLLSSTDWSTFNSKQNALTLTTTGSSGAATLVGATLNIPNYGSALTAYVPYTGATGAVDLGTNAFSASQININGAAPTSGSYLGFKHATTVNTGANGYTSMYTVGINIIAFKSINGANNIDFSFDMSAITPNVPGGRVYTLPNASGTLALTSDIPANPVGGTGTTNYIPKFTGASTIGNSATQTDATGNLMVGSANAGNAGTINVSVGVAGTTAGGIQLWAATNQTHYIQFGDGTTGAQVYAGYLGYAHSTDSLLFGTNGADKMTLTSSGHLGLGVTPSAWSGVKALQIGNGSLAATGNFVTIKSNVFYDGVDRYISNSFASDYYQLSGQHVWQTAPSGTAGNAITFTQAMTLNASGNLMLGTTTATTGFSRISLVGGESNGTGPNTGIQLTYNAGAFGGGAITTINAAGGGISFYNFTGNVGSESYSQVMTLFNTGNLLVQTGGTRTDNGARLQVSGAAAIGSGTQGINTDADLTLREGVAFVGLDFKSARTSGNVGGLRFYNTSSDSVPIAQQLIETDGKFVFYNGTLGAESRLTITSSGNVGIGTSSPTYTLEVNSGSAQYLNARFYSSSHSLLMVESTTAARQALIVHKTPTRDWSTGLDANGNFIWYDNTAAAYRMQITTGGNLLVGTTTDAGYKLDVNGTGRFLSGSSSTIGLIVGGAGGAGSTRQGQLRFGDAGSVYKIQGGEDYSAFNFMIGTGTPFIIASNGAATFSSSVTASVVISRRDATTSGTDAQFISENRTGTSGQYAIYGSRLDNGSGAGFVPVAFGAIQTSGAGRTGDFIVAVSNTDNVNLSTHERLRITSSGNVLIGTTTDAGYRLNVSGISSSTTGFLLSSGQYTSISGVPYIGMFATEAASSDGFGALLISSRTDVARPIIFGTSNGSVSTERMRITSGGNVLIGTTTDGGYKLDVSGKARVNNVDGFFVQSGSQFRQMYFDGFSTLYFWNGSNQANLSSAGAWVNASDISIKKNIQDLNYSLSDLLSLKPKSYEMKLDNLKQIGFIAQEVEKIIPELVTTDNKGMKGLNYGNMTALLVKAIQELKQEIDTLKN